MTVLGHEVRGQGPQRVILLHDWQGDHRNYALALPFLDTDAFTYALADLRGYGRSRDLAGPHTAAQAAADVVALADRLGWDRFHVVGHSMTGMVVQRVAIDARQRVASVVCANPVPASGLHMPEADLAFFRSTITDDTAFAGLLAAISNRELSPRWTAYKLALCRSSAAPAVRSEYLDMFNGTDFSRQARGLDVPLLVLLGEFDHEGLLEPAMRATFGVWYPRAEFKICVGAGHYPMQEMPPWYVAAIEGFMRRHPA